VADPIRMDEVLAELSRLDRVVDDGPVGFTCRELGSAIGLLQNAVQARLTEWVRSGRVSFVGHRSEINIAGRKCRIPVYRLVDTNKGGG
jgi:hypothetical protein